MEILAKLFGGETKVKLIRLFLFNPETSFTMTEIVDRSKSSLKEAKKEVSVLMSIGILKKKSISKDVSYKKGKKILTKKVQDTGFFLDQKFPYLQSLKNLLIVTSLHADENLYKKFGNVGRIKLFIASGLFIQEWDTRVDLLIVGDDINLNRLDGVIKNIEAEVGKIITYSAFETSDFEYRYGMHDRLIRDILDSPHTMIVDKLGLNQ